MKIAQEITDFYHAESRRVLYALIRRLGTGIGDRMPFDGMRRIYGCFTPLLTAGTFLDTKARSVGLCILITEYIDYGECVR